MYVLDIITKDCRRRAFVCSSAGYQATVIITMLQQRGAKVL